MTENDRVAINGCLGPLPLTVFSRNLESLQNLGVAKSESFADVIKEYTYLLSLHLVRLVDGTRNSYFAPIHRAEGHSTGPLAIARLVGWMHPGSQVEGGDQRSIFERAHPNVIQMIGQGVGIIKMVARQIGAEGLRSPVDRVLRIPRAHPAARLLDVKKMKVPLPPDLAPTRYQSIHYHVLVGHAGYLRLGFSLVPKNAPYPVGHHVFNVTGIEITDSGGPTRRALSLGLGFRNLGLPFLHEGFPVVDKIGQGSNCSQP